MGTATERIDRIDESPEAPDRIDAVTWNIAAINNNPFEFWVSHHDAEYLTLMEKARNYIEVLRCSSFRVQSFGFTVHG